LACRPTIPSEASSRSAPASRYGLRFRDVRDWPHIDKGRTVLDRFDLNSNTSTRHHPRRSGRRSGGRPHHVAKHHAPRQSQAPALEAIDCDTSPVAFTSLGLDSRLLEGIRDLGFWHGKYLVVAGPYDAHTNARLFQWSGGKAQPEPIRQLDLNGINAEAVIVYPGQRESFQLLSDDGTVEIDGICCKKLPDSQQKRFRSVWVTPPAH